MHGVQRERHREMPRLLLLLRCFRTFFRARRAIWMWCSALRFCECMKLCVFRLIGGA
jgi:hypothetical protein